MRPAGWAAGALLFFFFFFSCVIPTEKERDAREKSVCECVFACVWKSASMGERKHKKMKEISENLQQSLPLLQLTETSPLTSAWYIIIPVLWSRCNCLLSQAVVSKWWRKRNYRGRTRMHKHTKKTKTISKHLSALMHFKSNVVLSAHYMARAYRLL